MNAFNLFASSTISFLSSSNKKQLQMLESWVTWNRKRIKALFAISFFCPTEIVLWISRIIESKSSAVILSLRCSQVSWENSPSLLVWREVIDTILQLNSHFYKQSIIKIWKRSVNYFFSVQIKEVFQQQDCHIDFVNPIFDNVEYWISLPRQKLLIWSTSWSDESHSLWN